jgi:hypothetical protein
MMPLRRRSHDPETLDVAAARNGWINRLRILGYAVKEIGVTTLLLAVIVGWLSGWIPFPILTDLRNIVTTISDHDQRSLQRATERHALDVQLATTLASLEHTLRALARREHLRGCAEIRDADIRRLCVDTDRAQAPR